VPKVMDITSAKVRVNHSEQGMVVINQPLKRTNSVLDTGPVKTYGLLNHLKKQPAQRVGWQKNLRGGNDAKTLRKTNEEEEAGQEASTKKAS